MRSAGLISLVTATVLGSCMTRAVVPTPGEEVTMGRAYFDSVATLDPLDGIARFSGPLLSVAGSNDVVIAPQPAVAQRFLDAHDGPQSLVVLEADHTFDSFVGPDALEQAIGVTTAWLAERF